MIDIFFYGIVNSIKTSVWESETKYEILWNAIVTNWRKKEEEEESKKK